MVTNIEERPGYDSSQFVAGKDYRQQIASLRLLKRVINIETNSIVYQEIFVSDMGGTLGFLLGLSVIGLIVVLEKLLGILFLNEFIENYKAKKQQQAEHAKKSAKDPL